METIIAGFQTGMLLDVGRYEEAEALCADLLGPQRPMLVVPGMILAQMSLSQSLTRRGEYASARTHLNELIPLARRFGGSLFFAPALAAQAELEQTQGNLVAAREAMRESLATCLATGAVAHATRVLGTAVRLLAEPECMSLVELTRRNASRHPSFQAHLSDADAVLSGDPEMFDSAAGQFRNLGLRYQEARCLLEARQLERAASMLKELGLEAGPLGARLAELRHHDA
jgi:tetratricopeptide (TPR) repeat protein